MTGCRQAYHLSEYYTLIGQRLRQAREGARLSRRQVVEEMKRRGYRLSVSSLQDFEEGRRLNLQALLQLAEVLDRHPAEFLALHLSEDLDLEQLGYLIRRSSQLSPYEKEFFYAALNHVQRLRQEARLPEPAPTPIEASVQAVRRAVLRLLARGGAFAVKEMLALPQFQEVPETLVHREVVHLQQRGYLEPVAARPVRYALRRLPGDETSDVEFQGV